MTGVLHDRSSRTLRGSGQSPGNQVRYGCTGMGFDLPRGIATGSTLSAGVLLAPTGFHAAGHPWLAGSPPIPTLRLLPAVCSALKGSGRTLEDSPLVPALVPR